MNKNKEKSYYMNVVFCILLFLINSQVKSAKNSRNEKVKYYAREGVVCLCFFCIGVVERVIRKVLKGKNGVVKVKSKSYKNSRIRKKPLIRKGGQKMRRKS